jgi:uncharacterized RDD family membrane protein YckC
MDWFYADGGRQSGPVDDAGLARLVAAGTIRPETLVWRAGLANWQPYQTVAGPPPPPMQTPGGVAYCSECGKPYPGDELAAFGNVLVCGLCKPLYTQKLREGVVAAPMRYAGFWLRFLAIFLDGLILGFVYMMIFGVAIVAMGLTSIDYSNQDTVQAHMPEFMALYGFFILGSIAGQAAYEIWFVGRHGATPGKMACQLRVVTPYGGNISYARATGRHFAKYISANFTLYIGYIMAGFDDQKRSLHDRICETRVIKK